MAPINAALLAKIGKKTGLSKSRVYARIEEAVRQTSLPRHVAALLVARSSGVNFSRFASEGDLAMLRGMPTSEMPNHNVVNQPSSPAVTSSAKGTAPRALRKRNMKTGSHVFVVHGRNEKVRKGLFAFLRSVSVQPIEWNKALALTKKGSPYVGEVIDAAFAKARVILVLFTPDDEAKLKPEFTEASDPDFEKELMGQPRPNVLFEAGMAFGRQPRTTILVQVGKIRAVSDVAGRHIVHLTNSIASRQELLGKLKTAGLEVDDIGRDWHTEGDFGPT